MKYSMDQIKLAMADSGHFTQQETLWAAKQFKEVLGRMVKSGEKFSTDQIRQALSKLNKRPSKIDDVISQLKKNESIQESIESGKDTEEIVKNLTESKTHDEQLKDVLGDRFIDRFVSEIRRDEPKRGWTTFVIPIDTWNEHRRKWKDQMLKADDNLAPQFATFDSTGDPDKENAKIIFSNR